MRNEDERNGQYGDDSLRQQSAVRPVIGFTSGRSIWTNLFFIIFIMFISLFFDSNSVDFNNVIGVDVRQRCISVGPPCSLLQIIQYNSV